VCSPLGVVTKKVPEFIIYLSELFIALNYACVDVVHWTSLIRLQKRLLKHS
jgi:hypothetical protein